MMRAVLPFMKEKKHGAIINVCSKASASGAVAGLAYTTSKHGLVSFHLVSSAKEIEGNGQKG
jgi:NAD(P)-dependent dehydrogenase (short-subunit alcohol dehydrogenase family)